MSGTTRLPLTFQQEWLWDVIQKNDKWQCAPARAFRLLGPLNIELLRSCLEEVVGRHDALRVHIAAVGGIFQQEIRDPETYSLEVIEVGGASEVEVTERAFRFVERICDQEMNLALEPLWNARLLELSRHEHWLVFAMHRLIGDCASIDQTFHETKTLYDARSQDRESPLKAAAQYGDYTRWQQGMAVDWLQRHEHYWNRYLDEAVALQWPRDACPRTLRFGTLGKVNCSFGRDLSADVSDLARRLRTLPAVAMMAIYAAVLWRWCHQCDFVLPLNTSGRPTEYKSAIGYFSYAQCLRIHIAGDETYKKLVSHLSSQFFNGLAHQDFGRLARQRPDLLAGTLFQWVTLHSSEVPDEIIGVREFGEGLTVVPPGMTAMEVTVFDTASELRAFGSYRADLFARQTMERFMSDLRLAAEIFVKNPDVGLAPFVEAGGGVHGSADRASRESQWGTSTEGAEAGGRAVL
jgi:hypothetical protein